MLEELTDFEVAGTAAAIATDSLVIGASFNIPR
jgi:hypothetical protein